MIAVRIAVLLICAHLAAWSITFLAVVGLSPEVAFDYFTDAWSFSAGELPSLVWLYSWCVFLILLGLFFGVRWIIARRGANA
jgi:hypothetical protein